MDNGCRFWFGMAAPAKTPRPIIDKSEAARLTKLIKDGAVPVE